MQWDSNAIRGRPSVCVCFGVLRGASREKGPFYVFGDPIKRLLAAGEMTGGVHGAAFGKALSFGRLAARGIAKS